MASTSAGSSGPNSNYITLQRALCALRIDLESAVEQARSTGFAIVPGWDLDRIKQVGLYPDLKDEYWRLQDWAHAEAEDGTREYVKRLIEKSKQPHVSKEHTNRRLASKPAQHQAPKIRGEPERPLPGSDDETLGPAVFRRLKEAQQAQQQAEQQTQRQIASSKPEVPKKPVPSVATPPAPAKPADELAAQMGQLYIKSPPGTFARLLPPITGDQATIETLTVDGWTRWESGANLEWATTAMGSDGKLILKQDGMPAVARKLDPRAYRGTKKYDLGYCTGVLYSCEFPDWKWCPYRHWAPEPKEHRWMDPAWLVKNDKKLQRVPSPPDHPSVNYRGRGRRGFNDKWLVRPSVLKETEESKFQAPELRVSPTGWERETITATPETWRASDTRRVFEWSED